jgi:hypothetical protein
MSRQRSKEEETSRSQSSRASAQAVEKIMKRKGSHANFFRESHHGGFY